MGTFAGLLVWILGALVARAEDPNVTRLFVQTESAKLILSFHRPSGQLLEFGLEEGGQRSRVGLESFEYIDKLATLAWRPFGASGPLSRSSLRALVDPDRPGGLISTYPTSSLREVLHEVPPQREAPFALRIDVPFTDYKSWIWERSDCVDQSGGRSWDDILNHLAQRERVPVIKRWRATLPGRTSQTYKLFLVTLYDAYGTEPVLMEFAGVEIDRLLFAATKTFGMGNVNRFTVGSSKTEPTFSVDLDTGETLSVLGDRIFTVGTTFSSLVKSDVAPPGKFQFIAKVPNPKLVFEANTVNPVAYAHYFAPKHIDLKLIEHSAHWRLAEWPSRVESGAPEVERTRPAKSAPSLRGRLKERRDEVMSWIERETKPTVAEFLEFIDGAPRPGEENPFADFHPNLTELKRSLQKYLPRLIAGFAAAFPKATFYGLGRDIFLTTDALDAYYLHLGQAGRIVRAGASAGSFDVDNVAQVTAFLRTLGIDPLSPGATPHIFFDITSYGSRGRMSQSVQLMRAAYAPWVEAGHRPEDLLHRINFISTGYDGPTLQEVHDGQGIARYFDLVRPNANGPDLILKFPNSVALQYTDGWHAPYRRFVTAPGGRVIAPPGEQNSRSTKLKMLAELWTVVETVATPEFAARVLEQEKQFQTPSQCQDVLK